MIKFLAILLVTFAPLSAIGGIDPGPALPAQTGNAGKYLSTDGTDASWQAGGGGGSPGGATTNVQFNNSAAFGADSQFNWDSTNHRMVLGVAIGQAQNGQIWTSNTSGSTAFGYATENNSDSINTGGVYRAYRSRGTNASKTAVTSGSELLALSAFGHTGAAYASGALIEAIAHENWAVGSQGTTLLFNTTQDTTTSRSPTVFMGRNNSGNGQLGIYSSGATNALTQSWGGTTGYLMQWPSAVGSTGQTLSFTSSGASTWSNFVSSLTGDIHTAAGTGSLATTIDKLQGNPLLAGSPSAGNALVYSGSAWVPGPVTIGAQSNNVPLQWFDNAAALKNVLNLNASNAVDLGYGQSIIKLEEAGNIRVTSTNTTEINSPVISIIPPAPGPAPFIRINDGAGGGFVQLRAPTSLAGNTNFVLPPDNGTNGYVLKSDGSGSTSWTPATWGSTLWTSDNSNGNDNTGTKPSIVGNSTPGVNSFFNIIATDVPLADATTQGTFISISPGSILEPTSNQSGGGLNLNAGNTYGTGTAGEFDVVGGENKGTGDGGLMYFQAGDSAAANGGDFQFIGGVGNGGGHHGGNILLTVGFGDTGASNGVLKIDDLSGTITAGQVWTSTGTDGSSRWAALPTWKKELVSLSSGDITAQYICLAEIAKTDSISFLIRGGGVQVEGVSYDYSVSYTDGACSGKTKITFLNDLATGGSSALIAGDKVVTQYQF